MPNRFKFTLKDNYKFNYIVIVARSVEHIARAAKMLVISEPMAIFHPRDGKS